jgi:adenylosuccinate synthase
MRTGQVVIGANYGDEGKGLMTDYFASMNPDRCAVVRYNGGAQAGHTVVTADGRRHVFSHFGSGSFLGCPTYLSQFFIVNPILYGKEYKSLVDLGVRPSVCIDPKALVTTPYDMFINQFLERKRGSARHGSCGMGINETVTRCLRSPLFRTIACDFLKPGQLLDKLVSLGQTWFPDRLRELAIDTADPEVAGFVSREMQIIEQFICDVNSLLITAAITAEYPQHELVIFEGAQGLLLDEDRIEGWPHLTRSKTGLANVIYLARKYRLEALDVTYVSRTYLTRHGAGPLPNESDWSFTDHTNVPNLFQGNLRFAPLDMRNLEETVGLDLKQAKRAFANVDSSIAFTCLDQLPIPKGAFRAGFGLPVKYTSCGRTSSDVERLSAYRRLRSSCG